MATGTGNAALLAARVGAAATALDGAPRLIEIARGRAAAEGIEASFVVGDLHGLPFDDGAFEIALSVFGLIFAADPRRAFDEIFFVDLPDLGERAAILRIHLSRRKQDAASFDLERIAAAAEGFSGAELEQVVGASLLRALQQGRPLSDELILQELSATVPLSRSRREDIERLRAVARERFVPVR